MPISLYISFTIIKDKAEIIKTCLAASEFGVTTKKLLLRRAVFSAHFIFDDLDILLRIFREIIDAH